MGHPVFCLGMDQSLVLRNKYRDPSLGVARLGARLRCLRMTISKRRLGRSLDSVTRNNFLGGNCGALLLGGRRNVRWGFRGVKGIWGGWVRALVPLRLRSGQALRGLSLIGGFVAWLKPCPSHESRAVPPYDRFSSSRSRFRSRRLSCRIRLLVRRGCRGSRSYRTESHFSQRTREMGHPVFVSAWISPSCSAMSTEILRWEPLACARGSAASG